MDFSLQSKWMILFLIFICVPFGKAQESTTAVPMHEVNIIHPPFSITKAQLSEANSIFDLNKYNKASWVKEYKGSIITTANQGKINSAAGDDGTLTEEQKRNIQNADAGTGINVILKYIPDNSLQFNDVKEINFTFNIVPDHEASYVGGLDKMNEYLLENAIQRIPNGSYAGYDISAIKFSIDEQGDIVDAYIFENAYHSSKNPKVDALLLEAICNMPKWKPASYADGTKVKQNFAFTVGNHESCSINFLAVRNLPPE